ncbi:hypothetical protein [Vreelandella songnenensis]|uniref:hypothetical protein n=1 Tax=Vreelandella songnenensis TaxID=1176243 RepID=UPI000D04E8C9|nr:hypothetical protein [Halomonas songnenensis]
MAIFTQGRPERRSVVGMAAVMIYRPKFTGVEWILKNSEHIARSTDSLILKGKAGIAAMQRLRCLNAVLHLKFDRLGGCFEAWAGKDYLYQALLLFRHRTG